MRVRLEGITLIAEDVIALAHFYNQVIGFEIVVLEGQYAELKNSGVRLAICEKKLMANNTNQHHSYVEKRAGQAVELNFECRSPKEVYELYDQFITKGATPIIAPIIKDWGHTTAFFADPEGNIHSLFAVNS